MPLYRDHGVYTIASQIHRHGNRKYALSVMYTEAMVSIEEKKGGGVLIKTYKLKCIQALTDE